MEIRILRASDVRRFLPMEECIAPMERTMVAVSAGRTIVPLRSIMAMPGDRGMLGIMPAYLWLIPNASESKLVSPIPRNQPLLHSSASGDRNAIRARAWPAGRIARRRGDHGHPHGCGERSRQSRWLARPGAGDLTLLGAGSRRRVICSRSLVYGRFAGPGLGAGSGEGTILRPRRGAQARYRDRSVRQRPISRRRCGYRLHAHQGARAHPRGCMALSRHSRERGGLQRARGCGDRYAGRGARTILRRLPEFDRARRR